MRSLLRLLPPIALLSAAPAMARAAAAGQTMPQFEFSNPLVISQVAWMIAIMVLLYFLLSRWALPKMGQLLEHRASTIANDLTAARAAKTACELAIAELLAMMKTARAHAQAEIATAIAKAKADAALEAAGVSARLDAQLAESEAQIAAAVAAAMAAIKPVAESTAAGILVRLTAREPDHALLATKVDAAIAGRRAA